MEILQRRPPRLKGSSENVDSKGLTICIFIDFLGDILAYRLVETKATTI
jgi:hypothetical protein